MNQTEMATESPRLQKMLALLTVNCVLFPLG